MFRNQYDSSASTWSPQGRIHQIEYAMEAVKQGSATVGVKSKTHAVIVALKVLFLCWIWFYNFQRAQNDLSAHQKKCLRIAPHCGMTMAGLTADGRGLTNFMRTEALNHEVSWSFYNWKYVQRSSTAPTCQCPDFWPPLASGSRFLLNNHGEDHLA